jgi:hypothetical protein
LNQKSLSQHWVIRFNATIGSRELSSGFATPDLILTGKINRISRGKWTDKAHQLI